ncbi:MAG: aspartyl protease family protein [Kordia sp.]|uniref:aspartyl protease family protein n=1 Tax=Kordia sp. TaxID=1965332 RepID=UPI00385CF126
MKYLQVFFLIFFINSSFGYEHTIPFELVHNNIILHSQLNGIDCKLMYDTGARSFLLNTEFASKNSITAAKAFRGQLKGTFGDASMKIKYLLIEDLDAIAGDLYDGIIGIDFFKDFIVKIDYKNKVLSLSDSFEVSTDYIKVPTNHLLRNPTFLYWFTAKVEIQLSNGKTIQGNFLIDTGSGRSVSFTNKISKALLNDDSLKKVPTKGAKSSFIGFKNPTYVKVPSVTIGNFSATDYVVDCNTDIHKETTKVIDGILGSEFLKNFTIVINFKESSIYFKRNTTSNEPITNSFYSDGFQLKDHRKSGKGILISSIIQSDLFEHPIKIGDELLEVDGKPVSNINFNLLEKKKSQLNSKILYKIKRKRKVFSITTKVKDIFE